MRVAFLTTPQGRYADYWRSFLTALGVELAQPQAPFDAWLEAGRLSLPHEPLPVQLALGEILSLGTQVDAVLVPAQPPVRDDAWAGAFAELLPQRIAGLPTLIAVPDEPEQLAAAAADLGQRLVGNAGVVRRALEQVRPLGLPERREDWPPLQMGSHISVGVVGPRSLLAHPELNQGLWQALGRSGLFPVLAHTLPASQVASRGQRLDDSHALPGDRWLYGAARLMEGKGAVRGLVLVAPAQDAGMQAALDRVAAELHKPVLRLTVDAGQTEWPELAAFAARLGATRPQAD
ncbi:hypothetical protein [Deinococcus sp. Marseille-Q6407]|uniref:hypothetical protein n=1 Tax=Deinococcus sp. Marseille-Q6407 TaxID=2969223 RepID=UPI0021C14ABC|nr:hypothetical protein [Deinococcus sp. Marseille-Q6407]